MKKTIKFKFLLGFFIIFFMAFLLINYFVSSKLEENNEKTITNELITLKKNCNVYVRQAFMINHLNNNDIYFIKIGKDIVDELSNVTGSDIEAYTLTGSLIYSSDEHKTTKSKAEDINNAVNDKTSYTINYEKNNTTVYFSYPVVIAGQKVGILRIIKDYSSLYNESRVIINFILYVTIIIFLAAFIFSFLLSSNMTIPIVKLTQASNEVAKGNLDIHINSKRQDEIGELTRNFSKMVEKIDDQIKTIEKDRDNLRELNNHRKSFFDNVTHELKTPLTSILGYAEMIKENGFSDIEFFHKGTNHIINESKRLHNMVLKLLEVSKETSEIDDEFTKVEICKLLQNTCEGMTFKAKRYKNDIKCKADNEMYVYGNGDKLKEVFINIIDNAIKYGYSNSNIEVSTYTSNDFIEVTIKNRGIGIKQEDIEKIFNPLYRVNKKKSREIGSCGLGLSISKAIIDNHKGEIKIDSILNEETKVIVKLPSYKED
ncbi:sensor histidine kinase [Clostridium ganghwense]|uniref:histidine kinase n=1 Tax=Clostridium ganghwense TaxID=312089 RepID=A0ABT4CST1_9CLOT|nr:HAMP domain-containing sensor histidine kinase [Clostridium ganghwense]MCY6372117.1 HAMP domain-containing sensor histidine kinase [Clostridium ganghwense]